MVLLLDLFLCIGFCGRNGREITTTLFINNWFIRSLLNCAPSAPSRPPKSGAPCAPTRLARLKFLARPNFCAPFFWRALIFVRLFFLVRPLILDANIKALQNPSFQVVRFEILIEGKNKNTHFL